MTLTIILLWQIAIMALLMAVGYGLRKKEFLTEQGTKDLGALLLRVIIPCVVMRSYMVEYTPQRLRELLLSAVLAAVGFALALAVAALVYGRKRPVENFAAAFCNAGFIGIPLAQAVIGEEGVFYVAATVALLNLLQATYGVWLLTGDRKAVSLKTVGRNPVLIAIGVGLVCFFLPIPVPQLVRTVLGHLAGMNTPVAMILMGTYLAQLPLSRLADRRAWGPVALRLVGIPLMVLAAFWALPIGEKGLLLAAYLAAATPVGANICVFARQYDKDYEFSVVTVCLSTLLSVVTVPLLGMLAQRIL